MLADKRRRDSKRREREARKKKAPGVDELRASGGGKSEARKAQRSKEIKYSHGSDAQISSGTASGFAMHP